MILYHGTSERNLESILKDGLKANSEEHSNWAHSNEYENPKGFVYLGYTPFQHASNASYDGGRGVILEVEIPTIDNLYPDAHFLVFPNNQPLNPLPDKETVKKMVLERQYLTPISLERVFGAAHLGDIPTSAIKRYVIIDWKARKSMNDLWLQEMTMIRNNSKMIEYVLNEKWWECMPKTMGKTGLEIFPADERQISKTTSRMLKEFIGLK